ncbi:unnamed protein product [Periconia digitata]|uniref:Uncharacterized protein n=1 Tax=Periconia digitata TaxID=1303443 RepID=A0A9W4U639_9PLEO|nr:unnamed protein product [Periconia digitata]
MVNTNTAWRRDTSDFDFHHYCFYNPALSQKTISSGLQITRSGSVSMTTAHEWSSSNWILFFQEGRYFIRNYDDDLGALQLGIESKVAKEPKLLSRNGGLGQQWILTRADGGDENSWTLTNGLLGNNTYLGLDGVNLLMTSDKSRGTVWDIEMNESAGIPQAGSPKVQSIQNLEPFPVTSSSSTSTAATVSNTSSVSTPGSSAAGLPGAATSPAAPPPQSISPSLSTGAIAGIIIAALATGAILAALCLFLLSRRKKAKAVAAYASSATMQVQYPKQIYASHAPQLDNVNPVYEAPVVRPAQKPYELTTEYTAELESPIVKDAPRPK